MAVKQGINQFQTFTNSTPSSASFGEYNVIGVNGAKIQSMKDSIRQYVRDVDVALDELNNYDPTIAFQGDHVTALRNYIQAVKEACSAITSNMLAFNDKLSEVQTAYNTYTKNLASDINSTAQSTSSAYTRYRDNI